MCLHGSCNWGFFRNICLVFGLTLVALAAFCNIFWNQILEYAIEKELVLSPLSKSFGLWVENPMPFHIDFYFFNWTNPGDLKRPGYKPELVEVGPFRFREEVKKTEIKWNENKTVTYRKLRRWYFELHESHGNLDDVITTLNVIALTAAKSTRHWSRMTRVPLSLTLSSTQNLAISKRVREFLFEGFADPLIEFASKIPGLSSQVPFDRFGWFYKRNDSSEFDGVFNVETGANGLDVLGKLKFWNFKNHTSFYEGRCGEVKGSAGDFWPPQKSHIENISLFSPDMCRYINFFFVKEERVGNIKGYRYDSGSSLFDNGTANLENKCFCQGSCHPSGALNVSSCRFGAPAFVSYPHFHLADSSYAAAINGLKPDFRKHDMYIILEQKWGIPLKVAIRLQINILLESDAGIRMLDKVPTVFFPMIWFEQKVTMPEHMQGEIQFLLELPALGFLLSVWLYVVGFSCLVIYFFTGFIKRENGSSPCFRKTRMSTLKRSPKIIRR